VIPVNSTKNVIEITHAQSSPSKAIHSTRLSSLINQSEWQSFFVLPLPSCRIIRFSFERQVKRVKYLIAHSKVVKRNWEMSNGSS